MGKVGANPTAPCLGTRWGGCEGVAGSSTAPQALPMEERLQLRPGGRQARTITEINGPLTPKVPVINDLHDAAEWLVPRSPEPGHPQKAGEASAFLSSKNIRSAFPPVLLQSLLARLPTRWKPAQPGPRLTPKTSRSGFGERGRHQSSRTLQSGRLPSCKLSAWKPAPPPSDPPAPRLRASATGAHAGKSQEAEPPALSLIFH